LEWDFFSYISPFHFKKTRPRVLIEFSSIY
jgi:hypothetical protein